MARAENEAIKNVDEETKEIDDVFDKTTAKGKPGGLFQKSMTAIRSAHFQANRLRAGLVVAGLFTDRNMYREVLSMFYAVTKELELQLHKLQKEDKICAKLLTLGYQFTPQYEQDLEVLYGSNWKQDIQELREKNETLSGYCDKIRNMTSGEELAGAAFCLWGALIIGGGPAAKPRVQALCGPDAVHVFDSVTGPGRGERRTQLVNLWDSLAEGKDCEEMIVASCQDCMQCNNHLIASARRHPWWLPYISAAAVAILSVVTFYVHRMFVVPPTAIQ